MVNLVEHTEQETCDMVDEQQHHAWLNSNNHLDQLQYQSTPALSMLVPTPRLDQVHSKRIKTMLYNFQKRFQNQQSVMGNYPR